MYTLFIANKNYSSWSLRPWLLMREKQIPFTEKQLRLSEDAGGTSFIGQTPTGMVPCLQDGEARIWDSLAIVEYLAERHPGVWPTRADVRAWARCAAAEMHAGFATLRQQCPMNCGVQVRRHALSDALKRDLARIEALWNEGLERFNGPFLAGSTFTAVDAFYAPVALRLHIYGLELSPASMAYAHRLLELPALRQWVDDALKEDFREPGHERTMLENGTVVEDRRVAAH